MDIEPRFEYILCHLDKQQRDLILEKIKNIVIKKYQYLLYDKSKYAGLMGNIKYDIIKNDVLYHIAHKKYKNKINPNITIVYSILTNLKCIDTYLLEEVLIITNGGGVKETSNQDSHAIRNVILKGGIVIFYTAESVDLIMEHENKFILARIIDNHAALLDMFDDDDDF